MNDFKEMGLPEPLLHTLSFLKFEKPTPIQSKAIPVALEGRDILGSAQTGTGKTGAFGIPAVNKLMSNPDSHALVITPTRELAKQVITQLQSMLGKKSKIRSALLIGGEAMPKQLQQLRSNARLIVGTPGRINDHLQRKTLKLDRTDFVVLDETDRMLDMGFSIQIEEILTHIKGQRQTLLFSATLPKNIVKISDKYLTDPVRISVDAESSPAENIDQKTIEVKDDDKFEKLKSELDSREGSIIVFVKTKYNADRMSAKLYKLGYKSDAIHGDLRQNKRDKVIRSFREKKSRILIATDVAARGLDIPHIEHVINYDLPQCPEDYIHRIGRTARAGKKGEALNFVSSSDKSKWRAIEFLLNPELAKDKRDRPQRENKFNRKKRFGSKPFDRKKTPTNGRFSKSSKPRKTA